MNVTTTAPRTPETKTKRPASITAARVLWLIVAAGAALSALSSLLMGVAGLITHTAPTPAGDGLVATLIAAVLASAVSAGIFVYSRRLLHGDAHAREVLVGATAVFVLIGAFTGGTAFAIAPVALVLAAIACVLMFRKTSTLYLQPTPLAV